MTFLRYFKFILIFSISVCRMGCTQESAQMQEKLHVIVLVDETNSFVYMGAEKQAIPIWPQAISALNDVVIKSLRPGETFSLIGIDDHGHDPDDLRVKKIMPNAPLLVHSGLSTLLN